MREITKTLAIPVDGKPLDFRLTKLDAFSGAALLRLLSRFPEEVSEACAKNEPSIVTRATTDIAKAYNKYYYEHRILDGDPAATAARLQLTDACRQVIRTGLYLIGLSAPERM